MIHDPELIPFAKRIDQYELLDILGYGSFSVVRVARDSQTKDHYACKIVPRETLTSQELEERFETEIRVLQQMRHKSIVQLIDLKKDDLNYYIFTELCQNGELLEYIIEKGKLSEDEAKIFLNDIVDAVCYCHKHGVVHRDMKPENILFDAEGHVKISDFGFSRFVDKKGLVNTSCGSPCYASPEVLTGSPYDGAKSDIWSIGVILFAMVSGKLPWTKQNQIQLFEQIKNGEYTVPKNLSPECQDLIKHMLCVDPQIRYSGEEVLSHIWFKNVKNSVFTVKVAPHPSLHLIDEFFVKELSTLHLESIENFHSSRGSGFSNTSKMISPCFSGSLDNETGTVLVGGARYNKSNTSSGTHIEYKRARLIQPKVRSIQRFTVPTPEAKYRTRKRVFKSNAITQLIHKK